MRWVPSKCADMAMLRGWDPREHNSPRELHVWVPIDVLHWVGHHTRFCMVDVPWGVPCTGWDPHYRVIPVCRIALGADQVTWCRAKSKVMQTTLVWPRGNGVGYESGMRSSTFVCLCVWVLLDGFCIMVDGSLLLISPIFLAAGQLRPSLGPVFHANQRALFLNLASTISMVALYSK